MSLEENKAIVRRVFEEVWNQGRLDLAEEVYHPDYVFRNPSAPELHGVEAVKQFVASYLAAFPDMKYTIQDEIAEGDKVAARWECTGTHQGELMGIPATGKRITMTGISIVRIAEGKVVEDISNYDMLGALQQMGVIPPMG